jgi:hypothetical protein
LPIRKILKLSGNQSVGVQGSILEVKLLLLKFCEPKDIGQRSLELVNFFLIPLVVLVDVLLDVIA